MARSHWLMKSEPFKYSWDDLVRDGRTHWDGVRNYEARNNLTAMKKNDHRLDGLRYAVVSGLQIARRSPANDNAPARPRRAAALRC